MAERLVVIGGDAAGMGAAAQARRLDPTLEITALEKGPHTSYSACGLPYLVSGDVEPLEKLVVRTPQEFRDRQRIDVRVLHEVTGVDFASRRLEVRDHDHGRTLHVPFDQLLVATGARPQRPDIEGIDLPHVYGVQTLEDGARLLERAEESGCQRVVVIGGGYVGLEMAEAFCRWGAEVSVLDSGPHVMGTLDADMADLVAGAMKRHEIDVQTNTLVTGIEPGVVHTLDREVPADLVVLGAGVTPNTELVADGLELGHRGSISVNQRQQASVEGVWAAGDCAESFHRVTRRGIHVALGTVANRQARVAGINLGGGYATFPGVVGTAVTRLCSTEIARTGLTEREAVAAGFGYVVGRIESSTRAGYFPGSESITVKVIAERGSGRVLGGQIVGGPGSAKRIDALATAVIAEMSVGDVVDLDLGYAPPFGPVWDPIQTAARVALRAL